MNQVRRHHTGQNARNICSLAIGPIVRIPEHKSLAERMEKSLDERMYHAVFFVPYQGRFRYLATQPMAGGHRRIIVMPVAQDTPMLGQDSASRRFIPGTAVVLPKRGTTSAIQE
jgi:hypothetical protein